MEHDLLITDRFDAVAMLRDPALGAHIQHVLSIGDPGQEPPAGFEQHPARKIYLQFHDIDMAPGGPWASLFRAPDETHAAAIIEFSREISGPLLVHCQAGISRSTAAAALILAARTLPGQEEEVARRVKTVRPQAWPNRLLVGLGDDLLGRRGALLSAVIRICYGAL